MEARRRAGPEIGVAAAAAFSVGCRSERRLAISRRASRLKATTAITLREGNTPLYELPQCARITGRAAAVREASGDESHRLV